MSFAPSGFFVFRTPLLPFDDFLAWSKGLQTATSLDNPTRFEYAFAADGQLLRARLTKIANRPEVREALFVASPHLEDSLQAWARKPESERGKGIELAIARYFVRMAGRSTPFGLCAGCSVGTLGKKTQLALHDRTRYQRHTRLDMDYLDALCTALARDPRLRRVLSYRPNSSLYHAAGRVRYVESRFEKKNRSFHLIAVEETESLAKTLDRAKTGSSYAALAEALVDEEISLTDAEEYISELIESQILMPDLAPCVAGCDPIQSVIEQFEKQPAMARAANILERVRTQLTTLDAIGLGNAPERYRAIAELLQSLPPKVELPRLFQVDMVKPMSAATLGKAVVDEIVRGVNILHRLTGVPSENSGMRSELDRFRDAFVARYEGREVPVVEALDAEIGIGFPPSGESGGEASPLLNDLVFPAKSQETADWGVLQRFLLRKLSEALQNGAQEVVLQPSDLEKISAKDPVPLPDAFAVTAIVAAADETAVARGDFRVVLEGAAGPSGARLLGRFCHADKTLRQKVEGHLRAEESLRPEAVFAEIVHLPQGRLGNILARPMLRTYEIPYLGRAGGAADRQIPITDLYVSVRENRIVLRSARLGREIIPRLTSAHNFHGQAVGLYRFLCLLQGQGIAENLGWTWGALESAPFLPRVTMGRLVLARARWNVDQKELKPLCEQTGSARFRTVDAWRNRRRLPQLVALTDGDHTLPIDFDNILSVETFVHLTKGREEMRLLEIFPPPDQLCARGPEGRFLHELIIPFVRKAKKEGSHEEQKAISAFTVHHSRLSAPRTFPPGSEWLYAKLYTGNATADYVLREVIGPLTTEVLQSRAADQWFFIRYGDPDWHLRLRFHGNPERLRGDVMPAIEAAATLLLKDGRLARVQFDTYEREVERYGGAEGIVLAERIFQADSEAVLEIIENLEPGDTGLDERWRLVLRGVDALLQDFGFDPATKFAVIRKARAAFAKEIRVDGRLKGQIGDRFREERKKLEALLDSSQDAENALSCGFEIFHHRSARVAPIVAELKASEAAGRLFVSLQELAPSYIHMHANRLLRSAHRTHELVLYDFLARLYGSKIARRP
jgi:Lantibiotic dehydratase, C terminus./Lantibiotic dehydratase, N terminus.